MSYERPVRRLEPLEINFGRKAFCCPAGERFSSWVDTLISRLTKDGTREPTPEQMQEAKARLLDEYRKERNGALRSHRDRVCDDEQAPCIYGVFLAALERLAEIVISPTITEPSPPSRSRAKKPAEEPKRPRSTWEALSALLDE
jgi:hypothetical protein